MVQIWFRHSSNELFRLAELTPAAHFEWRVFCRASQHAAALSMAQQGMFFYMNDARKAFVGDTDLLEHTRKGTDRERAHNTVTELCKQLARAARHVVVNALTEGMAEENIKDKAFRMQVPLDAEGASHSRRSAALNPPTPELQLWTYA